MVTFSRRRFIIAGAAGQVLLLPAMAKAAKFVPMPRQTEGPFYPDIMPDDVDNNLVKIIGKTKAAGGEILGLSGRVLDATGAPIPDALIEIWQADTTGQYVHSRSGGADGGDPYFQGFGKHRTSDEGAYAFRTIRPVAYTSRCPHIHVKVFLPNGQSLTSQIFVAGAPENERDWLYRRLSESEREAATMTLMPAEPQDTDWTARFDMVVPG